MTYPRSHLVDPEGGTYHVCSRCVRRAFLCGIDNRTGFNFDHRRQWLEERIFMLSDIFAVDLFGYAVMSNHYHIVLATVPSRVESWSDDEVAEKWLTLFPRKSPLPDLQKFMAFQKTALVENQSRITELRARLSSLSWFMRCLNEPLARLANQEDGCKGRFWEGRFKSQALLDDTALLAAMVYVDLNPIRAGLEVEPGQSPHTSIHHRKTKQKAKEPIRALNVPHTELAHHFSLEDYQSLAEWTAMAQQSKGPISASAQRVLAKANAPNAIMWLQHYQPKPGQWQRAQGSFQSLKDYAKDLGQCWIRTRSAHLMRI